jgi:hypothetical protein
MDEYELEPELAGYVPTEGIPRRRHMLVTMRVLVTVGIVCLVLPGILTTWNVASATANDACAQWVKYESPGATGENTQFELMGAYGIGWQCYSSGGFGGAKHVASLGLIPISPTLSPVPKPATNS